MKRIILLAASAMAILAGCTRTEIRSIADEPQQITFRTIETKGAEDFDKRNKFISYAWFLENGKTWDANSANGQAYISGAEIAFDNAINAWKASGQTYYWPKQGSLTFFAWTDDTAAPSVGTTGASVTCAHDTGIKIKDYSVKDNPNKDILVAEIAKDKKSNESATGTWEKGVPTVFRHALAKVEFKVNKKTNYPNVTFKVKSITLNGVSTKGTFTQGSPDETTGWKWSGWAETNNLTVFSSTAGKEVTKTAEPAPADFDALNSGDYSIVLPQNFDATSTLTIVYDIITSYVAGTPVTETVKETKALNGIYTSNWECKKKYVLGITLGLNEIYWDPSVVDWEDGTVTDIPF